MSYAFWKHDQFPFVLGGKITKTCNSPNGDLCETSNYGKGHWFHPFKIVDNKQGDEILRALRALQDIYLERQRGILEDLLVVRNHIIQVPEEKSSKSTKPPKKHE